MQIHVDSPDFTLRHPYAFTNVKLKYLFTQLLKFSIGENKPLQVIACETCDTVR